MNEVHELPGPLDRLERKLDELAERLAAPPQRWLTVARAALYADLSEESIRRLIASGKLTAHRPVKGRVLIDRNELDDLIRATANQRPRHGRGGGRTKATA